MKALTIFAALCLAGAVAFAEDEPKAAPPAEAPAAEAPAKAEPAAEPAAPAKEEPKAEAAKEEPKPQEKKAEAPKEEKKKEAPKPAEKKKETAVEAPKAEEKPAPSPLSPEERLQAEWKYLSARAQSADGEIQDGVIEHLKVFIEKYRDASMRPDALYLLAGLRQKRGDVKGGLVDLLRLAYEYPESKYAMKARSDFLDGAGKKFSRKFKPAEEALAKAPKSDDKTERLASLAENLGAGMEDNMYDASVDMIHHFEARFPDYAGADKMQWSLGQLHEKANQPASALVAYEELLAVHPESALRPKTQFAVGALYADNIKDYKKAVEAFADVVEKYPSSPEVLPSLQRSAGLYSDKLRQYQLAVEIDEKIVKLFPKTDGALSALRDEASLQRERLKAPQDAIKTDQRLAEMFPTAGVAALQDAATIARKDLKDFKQEVEIRHSIAKNYASAKEAPEELWNAATTAEEDLKDDQQAIALYKELAANFPGAKQAKKASSRLEKLDTTASPNPAPPAKP